MDIINGRKHYDLLDIGYHPFLKEWDEEPLPITEIHHIPVTLQPGYPAPPGSKEESKHEQRK